MGTALLRPPRQLKEPPRAVVLLTNSLHWSRQDSRLFWNALREAQWSQASDFRQRALLFDRTRPHTIERVDAFVFNELAPAKVVEIIELLHVERLLSREDATRLQQPLLDAAGPDGRWREA